MMLLREARTWRNIEGIWATRYNVFDPTVSVMHGGSVSTHDTSMHRRTSFDDDVPVVPGIRKETDIQVVYGASSTVEGGERQHGHIG